MKSILKINPIRTPDFPPTSVFTKHGNTSPHGLHTLRVHLTHPAGRDIKIAETDSGKSIICVPTQNVPAGGHLSLLARARCRDPDCVVEEGDFEVSIYRGPEKSIFTFFEFVTAK